MKAAIVRRVAPRSCDFQIPVYKQFQLFKVS